MKTVIAVAAVLLAFAAPARAERTHTVVPKDCLWDLAKHYYQNPFRWRVIHAANTNIVKDPHWIYPKQVLVIPDDVQAEIGELPARPVETQPAPDPDAEVAEPSEPKEPVQVAAKPLLPGASPAEMGLSRSLPEGLAGGFPSMARVKIEKGWKEDGKIIEFEGREIMAAQGDVVQGKLPSGGAKGDTFLVYRKVSALEHEDPKSDYLQTVGVVRVDESVGKQAYRMTILKSGDSVQLGDLLKRAGS